MRFFVLSVLKKLLFFLMVFLDILFIFYRETYYSLFLIMMNHLNYIQLSIHDYLCQYSLGLALMIKCSKIYYWFIIGIYVEPTDFELYRELMVPKLICECFWFLFQVFFLTILAIWARAAGPRFRIDQILSTTWKDMFIFINCILMLILFIFIIV